MYDIFQDIYYLPNLTWKTQFMGVKARAANLSLCTNRTVYTKEMFLADYPQFSRVATSWTSTFTRDPSNVGGSNAVVTIAGDNAYVTGSIAWYAADEDVGRPEGNCVGFAITAPDSVEDVSDALFSIDGGAMTLLRDDPNVSGNPRVFWWYPLVTDETISHQIVIDWDGLGPAPTETFTIYYVNVTLETEEQTAQTAGTTVLAATTAPTESIVPDAFLQMILDIANLSILECRWNEKWRFAIGLYVAHYATLYLRAYQEASPDNTPESAAGSGSLLGVVSSAKLGDAQVSYDTGAITSGTTEWGALNSTSYGQLLASEARLVSVGGSYII